MKKVEALIPTCQVSPVTDALRKQGVDHMVISEVLQSGSSQDRAYRGVKYAVDYEPEIKLETVVSDQFVTATTNRILEVLQTGSCGEARMLITSVENIVEIGRDQRPASIWTARSESGSSATRLGEAIRGA